MAVTQTGVTISDFSTEHTAQDGQMQRAILDWAITRLVHARKLFETEPRGMDRYTSAIRQALRTENWFGALFLSLAMPDICGSLETPNAEVGTRYRRWFDRYLASEYVPALFSAADCYYLRCSALHQGLSEHPRAQQKQVVFISPPPPGIILHSCYSESPDGSFVLQLQIDVFCEQVCAGVQQWTRDVTGNVAIQARIRELLEFQDPSQPLKMKL